MYRTPDDIRLLAQLEAAAFEALEPAYLDALRAQLEGRDGEQEWKEFEQLVGRAWMLAHLIGRASAVATLRRFGVPIHTDEPHFTRRDRLPYAVSKSGLMTAPFTTAINLFSARVPMLRQVVDGLTVPAKEKAFWITGIEKTSALTRVRDHIARLLAAEEPVPVEKPTGQVVMRAPVSTSEFVDTFERDEGTLGLTRAHLWTVVRTNLMSSLNIGHRQQATSPLVIGAVALLRLDEIHDRRTRGAPGTENPGFHWQMDGFMERPDHPIWERITPPNGYQCRGRITPITWGRAAQLGLADAEARTLDQDALDAYNGERWGIINRGDYPDEGFGKGN